MDWEESCCKPPQADAVSFLIFHFLKKQ